MVEHPPRVIALVGLPGSGKTTAAAGLASLLGWEHVDLDLLIEEREHQRVAEIFAQRGEKAFRAIERDLSKELCERRELVLSVGGGWMSNRDAVACLRPIARIMYLRVTPATAIARLGTGLADRPLLLGDDPLGKLTAMLERRAGDYESADAEIDVEPLDTQQVIRELHVLATNFGVE